MPEQRERRAMLRGSRETIDAGAGKEKRIAGGRAKHASRGQFVNFYEDLGISTTPDRAVKIREDEKQFQSAVQEQKGKIASAQSQYKKAQARLNAAKGSIPGVGESVEKAWEQAQGSLIPIKIITSNTAGSGAIRGGDGKYYVRQDNGTYRQVEAPETSAQVYKMPKQTADSLSGFSGKSWWEGGTLVVEAGRHVDAIEKQLDEGRSLMETSFKSQAADEIGSAINSQKGEINKAQSMLNQYGSQISAARSTLMSIQEKRDMQWQQIRGDYQKKLETLREIFGGLEVEDGDA